MNINKKLDRLYSKEIKIRNYMRQIPNLSLKPLIIFLIYLVTVSLATLNISHAKMQLPTIAGTEMPKGLVIKIGQKLYLERKQGCATCHGLKGTGGDRAKEVNLTRPTSWKSHKIASVISCSNTAGKTFEQVAVELILNGPKYWNEKFYPQLELDSSGNKILLDKQMIGIHSSAFKRNVKSINRILRKNKIKLNTKEIPKLMANSVFYYVSEQFFTDDVKNKTNSPPCKN